MSIGLPGRPSYDIPEEQLQFFVEHGFTTPQISGLLGVSVRTVTRYLTAFGLQHRRSYSHISDQSLDVAIVSIQRQFPNCGYRMMQAHLRSLGLVVQRDRVCEALARVDPVGTALRWSTTIPRRRFRVASPNSLWHIVI